VSLLLPAETEFNDTTVAEMSMEELHDTEMVSQENALDNSSMIKEALDWAVRAALDDLLEQHIWFLAMMRRIYFLLMRGYILNLLEWSL
jgi:hypothetical protein